MRERIVCVEWDDAAYNSGFYDEKSPDRFSQVRSRTVGYVVASNSRDIIVSQERFYDSKGQRDGDRHICTIPKKMIRKITELKG